MQGAASDGALRISAELIHGAGGMQRCANRSEPDLRI